MGLALLLLQLSLPAAVSALEVVRDAGDSGHVVHVESEATEDCALHHDHHFCQVVRNVVEATRRASPPVVAAMGVDPSSAARPSPRLFGHRSLWLQDRHSSRAPPAA